MEKAIRVDLSNGKISIDTIPNEITKKYIGGMGIATYIFTKEVLPSINPYDPENLLIFSVGPFCGTIVPFCGRHFVMAKSPLTGIIGESSSGGFWGKELRSTGFNHVIVKGKSEMPVYLWIQNDKIEIHDASEIWGKGVFETEDRLKMNLGDDKIKIASIGPGGENLVKFASIMNDQDRAAGRCGLGAVMGSKKLKSIAVRGTNTVEVKNREKLTEAVKKLKELMIDSPLIDVHKQYGTTLGMDNGPHMGDVPIKNFSMSRWLGTKKIGGIALMDNFKDNVRTHSCFNCPVGCAKQLRYEGKWFGWPEYETLAMMGSNLMVDDLSAIVKWNIRMNDLGIDTISLGSVIAMYIEAIERRLLIKKRDVLDVMPKWGDVSEIETLIDMIAYRKGIGNDLAEGVRNFCKIKGLPNDFETHGKGLEVPAHEPRSNNMTALDYITSPRGAYHCQMPMDISSAMYFKIELGIVEPINRFSKEHRVAELVKIVQDGSEAYCACGGCIFGFKWIPEVTPWIESLNSIVGESYTVDLWKAVGERLFNMKRVYNMSCGTTKADDIIGSRFSMSMKKGPNSGNVPPLEELTPVYYKIRGWDKNGHPTANQLS